MYSILLKNKPQSGGKTYWSFYEKTSGIIFETEDLDLLQGEVRYLLDLNPIPVLKVVQEMPFNIEITMTEIV